MPRVVNVPQREQTVRIELTRQEAGALAAILNYCIIWDASDEEFGGLAERIFKGLDDAGIRSPSCHFDTEGSTLRRA